MPFDHPRLLADIGGTYARFAIERERFPTNARKTAKIAANKEAKFAKVAEKLIAKIRHASPAVEVSGA